ncbi:potassium channel family protein [Thomasclavelia ramosa]|uniref:potassium channel family protein n=1 Tax=Thomasclavelia ramosa TaxID=1547 RepID=UPI0018A060F9|nr:potassium channel family protein [Thomasclavelia ramosa]
MEIIFYLSIYFFALIDFLSIVPAFTTINSGFKALKLMRVLKCFKIFKTLRYSKSFMLMVKVFEKEKNSLITVFITAIGYIGVTALIMFNAESSFKSYFDAVYWATTALTTVGYGDIYPVSDLGKIVSMTSSFIGIAIVAIPSGIITSGYIDEVKTD